ncbi:MAG: DUF559 domain-containing protein, partial [Chloroflexota bacterium]
MTYAEVAINTAVNQTFHYAIPPSWQSRLVVGHLVRVSFGTAMQAGIVVAIHDELPPELHDVTMKPIIDVLHPEPVMVQAHIDLALWMSEAYLASPGTCLWLMLPPGIVGKSTQQVFLGDAQPDDPDSLTTTQQKILEALNEEAPRSVDDLVKITGVKSVRRVIKQLEEDNLVAMTAVLNPPTATRKTVRTVMRAIPEDEVVDALANLQRAPKQTSVFAYIAKHDYPLDVSDVYEEADATSADLNNLERKGFVELGERIVFRDSLADRNFIPSQPLALTTAQNDVWQRIRASLQAHNLTELSADTTQTPRSHNFDEASTDTTQIPPLNSGEVARQRRRGSDDNFREWKARIPQYRKTKLLAKRMRKKPTPAEQTLWHYLRKKKLGIKFRRQMPLGPFIADFYSSYTKIIIEVDGDSHTTQQEYDAMRTAYLTYLGCTVLRVTNQQIHDDIEAVLAKIQSTVSERLASIDAESSPLNSGEVAHQHQHESRFLLHGVTGAGKTEIYLHAIAETLAQGRQALFLVPEIALTPQTIRRVAQRFPEKVAVVHGSLSTGERFDTWRRARDGDISVIVGTRSALFTPLPDVGLIILDESHDHSYKQSPPINPPYYNARDVAQKLAKLNDATLIFGSATPAIETMYAAKNGNLTLLELPNRIMGHRQRVQKQAKQRGVTLAYQPADSDDAMTIGLPPVHVVDMREELKAGNLSMFSRDLQASLQGVLERGEQAILFLNRRGQATYVFCRDCGYVVECPNCDTPLTYHRHGEAMRCHHCGHQQPAPDTCPNCSSRRIRYFGAGTQHVESALREQFPRARILRWDRDT